MKELPLTCGVNAPRAQLFAAHWGPDWLRVYFWYRRQVGAPATRSCEWSSWSGYAASSGRPTVTYQDSPYRNDW